MDLNTNQKGNLAILVILILALLFYGGFVVGWSDPYMTTVASGLGGGFVGRVISPVVTDNFNQDGSVSWGELFLSLCIAVIISVVIGAVFLLVVAEFGDLYKSLGNGAYAGTLIISGIASLFGVDFNQLEESK